MTCAPWVFSLPLVLVLVAVVLLVLGLIRGVDESRQVEPRTLARRRRVDESPQVDPRPLVNYNLPGFSAWHHD